MPMNDPRYLTARADEVRDAVLAELPSLPVTLTFEAYVGRKPILTVTATTPAGAKTSRDFDFLPLDELHTLRLTNTLIRLAKARYEELPQESPAAADNDQLE